MRLIDADALKEHYNVPDAEGIFSYCDTIMQVIDSQPTIEPEVRHGRWIAIANGNMKNWKQKCSCCGYITRGKGKYCKECGARMDGGDDNG